VTKKPPRARRAKAVAPQTNGTPSPRERVFTAWVDSVTKLIEAPPRHSVLIPLQERAAALGYQLGMFPLPPDPDIEWRLSRENLLIRPCERDPDDAEIDREFDEENAS